MYDILHSVGVCAPPRAVYTALTTQEGLAAWWTNDTTGEFKVGGVICFRFGERGFFKMKVRELVPAERVVWDVVDGPDEWVGATVTWDLKESDGSTVLHFKHQGWREPSHFMHHCSTKWASFIFSLKGLLESGDGRPWPNEVRITLNAD